MPFPKFTQRLNLQPMKEDRDCFATIVGWLNDPDVVRFSEQRHRCHDINTQTEFFRTFPSQHHYLAIYTANDSLLIGTMTIHCDYFNLVANVGIMMGEKSKWGKGYGNEAWTAVCEEIFKNGFRKIETGCMSINYRMMAICQHFDMIEEGRQDKHFVIGNGTADLVHWGKFNEPSSNIL